MNKYVIRNFHIPRKNNFFFKIISCLCAQLVYMWNHVKNKTIKIKRHVLYKFIIHKKNYDSSSWKTAACALLLLVRAKQIEYTVNTFKYACMLASNSEVQIAFIIYTKTTYKLRHKDTFMSERCLFHEYLQMR